MDKTNATPDSQLDKQTQEEACPPACLFNGVVAGASSYVLGLAFGFGSGSLRHRGHGRLKAGWKAGREGGKNFAIFGAVYSLALCYAKKFRKTEDPINSAIAGCCTGLALGWKGGPTAALQNCLTLGAFSWVLESINPAPANAAVPITGDGSPCFQKQGDGVYLQSVLTLACPQPLGWCFRNAPGCSLDMVKG